MIYNLWLSVGGHLYYTWSNCLIAIYKRSLPKSVTVRCFFINSHPWRMPIDYGLVLALDISNECFKKVCPVSFLKLSDITGLATEISWGMSSAPMPWDPVMIPQQIFCKETLHHSHIGLICHSSLCLEIHHKRFISPNCRFRNSAGADEKTAVVSHGCAVPMISLFVTQLTFRLYTARKCPPLERTLLDTPAIFLFRVSLFGVQKS